MIGEDPSASPRDPRYGEYDRSGADRTEIAVRVTAADFNGSSFDGSPFSVRPRWLNEAIRNGYVRVSDRHGDRDYAVFEVVCGTGVRFAFPGDYIIRRENGTLSLVEADDAFILINLRSSPPPSDDEERVG